MNEFIEKLIKSLKEWSFETTILIPTSDGYEETADREIICTKNVIEIVNELAEEYNNTSTDTSSGWIPCSERLPEEYGEYLCCDRYGEYIIGYPTARVSSDDYYVETEHEIMNDCIAWQPLPQAYQEEGEENDNN